MITLIQRLVSVVATNHSACLAFLTFFFQEKPLEYLKVISQDVKMKLMLISR